MLSFCGAMMFAQNVKSFDVNHQVSPKKISVAKKILEKPAVSSRDYYENLNTQNAINPKLYKQELNYATNVTSQKFEAGFSTYDSSAADDFVVPAGVSWNISDIYVSGTSTGDTYPDSYNVTFYANSGSNLPAAVIRTENIALAAGSISPTLVLATPLVLASGTYWVSVQAVMDSTVGAQWFWNTYTSGSTLGAPFAWTNPGNGFGTTCSTGWNTGSICLAGQLTDLQFSLNGIAIAPCKTITGRILTTDPTHTPRITRDGVSSLCGIAKVYPGDFGSANFHYKSYNVQNTSASPECVTFNLTNLDPNSLNQVHLVAYAGSFNPANISQNYLGDTGSSSLSGSVVTMSVTIPANTTVVIVATEPTANTVFTADFTIDVISANCGSILKTIEIAKDGVSVYPNPTTSVLFVSGMQPKKADIFDNSGKLIPAKISGNTIDTQKLPKGNYILKMEDKDGKSSTTKFIKK